MRLPWVSRVLFERLVEENGRLREELEHERGERQKAVDTMLANARLMPMHAPERAQGAGPHRRIPKRIGMIDMQRRLEAREAAK